MNIIEALKSDSIDLRISSGWRWLYFDNTSGEWVVMNSEPCSGRRPKEIERTTDEAAAVAVLVGDWSRV